MKKILTAFTCISLTFGLFMGCADITENTVSSKAENISHTDKYSIENINSEIVLGEKIENFFTVEKVNARNAADGIEELVEANYIYFRCRTDDENSQKWLSEKFEFLSIIPLDREILEGGTIYKDPELSEDETPWFYLMRPIEDYSEVVEHGLTTEIIDEMYLDEEDKALLTAEGLEIPEDTYLTVNPEEESARFGGWIVRKIKKIIKKYVANCPHGKVSVYDTIQKKYVPVKNVQVISHQLGAPGIAFTNGNGNFNIPVPYTSLGGKVQIIIRFENPDLSINIPTSKSALLEAYTYYEGSHWIEGISDLDIKFNNNSNCAKCSTILNAYNDYCDYCNQNSVAIPNHLNIWPVPNLANSCTTLCRYAGREIIPAVAALVSPVIGFSIATLTAPIQPDIIIGTKTSSSSNYTEKIYGDMFHELSHASHYFGLGSSGKTIWIREYADMIKGWVKLIKAGKDPIKDCYNGGGTDLVKLIESWGYFSGNYIMAWKYPNKKIEVKKETGTEKVSYYYDSLENRKLDYNAKTGKKDLSKPYFYYGGLYDLIDSNDEINIDYCRNFNYKELYKALTSSGVDNLASFANALVKVTNRKSDLQNVIKTLEANHN